MDNENTSASWRIPPVPIKDDMISETYSADVVVVGLGHAGSCAVRAAAESGASVIGFEQQTKMKYWVWGHDVGHINSDFLASRGVPKVDPLEYFNEWMRRSGNRAFPKLVMKFCKKSGEAFNWYVENFTEEQMDTVIVEYWPTGKNFSGQMTGHKFWPGTAQFDNHGPFGLTETTLEIHRRSEQLGAKLFFGMDAQQLVKEGERVTGVIARSEEGKYVKFNAAKGVILASGDFSGNADMRKELLIDIVDLFDEGDDFMSLGRDGKGIAMGVWAGGRLEARPMAAMGGNMITPTGVTGSNGILWVNSQGERFCNEAFGDPVFTGMSTVQEKHTQNYNIFDSSVFEFLQYGAPAHGNFFINDEATEKYLKEMMEGALAAGANGKKAQRGSILYAAETLEELADYLGFAGDIKQNFLNSVERYNEMCERKRDEDYGKDPRYLYPLKQPPYYGEKVNGLKIGFMLCACGGLLTDENQQVLNMQKDPIPGLFATGNCCGRRFGPQYSTPTAGVSIGIAITLGREAGLYVAGL